MTQQKPDASPANRLRTPPLRRVSHLAARLVGGASLAFGAVDALAKRRKKNSDQESGTERESRQEERPNGRRTEGDDSDRTDKKDARQEGRDARQDENGRDRQSRNDSVDQEQQARQNNDNNNNNGDDTEDADSDDDGGGNNRGNAGSGFFDSPLATKTQRRANDFDDSGGRDDEPEDDRLVADSDGDSLVIETNSVAFSNGPDGLEVVTRNIEFSAPPTPTPTPFPTLTLPERDRLDVFGDRVITAPTSVPVDDSAAPPPSTDTGTSGSTDSRPTPTPTTGDTSGGDNTSDFLS
jgi:hypothetical protein